MKKVMKNIRKYLDNRELKEYYCGYCDNNFDQAVKKSKYASDQVICPRCNNMLKTW